MWIPLLTAGIPLLVFSRQSWAIWAGATLWGIVLGAHESTLRAAVADLIPVRRRDQAYGDFNAVFGLGWFVGSAVLGVLYGRGLPSVWGFVLLTQAAAVAVFRVGGVLGDRR